MAIDKDSARLLNEYVNGDEAAAQEIFHRYVEKLTALAEKKLSRQIQQRVDAEDIIQSVYRSFFRKAKDDKVRLRRSGDLWRLLAGMTIKKVLQRVEYETAKRRDPAAEVPGALLQDLLAKDPGPEEQDMLPDLLKQFMASLSERPRIVLERRLQGQSQVSISRDLDVSESTIRRILRNLKTSLQQLFLED